LLAAQRALRSCRSVPELFSQACAAATGWCRFSRAIIVDVSGRTLIASSLATPLEAESDALRRRLLAHPITLRPRTTEAELIRSAEGCRGSRGRLPSLLQDALGLEHFALGAVMPEDRVIALLVLDRRWPAVRSDDRDAVQTFAYLLASALERLVLRQRLQEFAVEIRYLTTSAQALVQEALESPVAIPEDSGSGPVFAWAYPAPATSDQARHQFTRRELDVAEQLVAGRSNRDIAARLQISPDTVKAYVARVMRKLEASNRADAAVRFMRLTSPGHQP
jgi:DNA-binding CsgD family transcriptional regulator